MLNAGSVQHAPLFQPPVRQSPITFIEIDRSSGVHVGPTVTLNLIVNGPVELLPQSGKTKIMLDGITKFMVENRNTLVLILCDNNLMLTSQTRVWAEKEREIKVGKITCDARGYCEW